MLTDWRFRRLLHRLRRTHKEELETYAAAAWPTSATPIHEASLVALDFELDGLKGDAHLLQAGWVAFSAAGLPLATARSRDIRSKRMLDDKAVTIHGIGEERARVGTPLEQVIAGLVPDLAGKVIIAHGADIERDCLSRASQSVYGLSLPVRTICTMAVERKLNPSLSGARPYRLSATRARYNLPDHDLHSAMGDAIATAELFLAQLSNLPKDTTLGQLEALRVRH